MTASPALLTKELESAMAKLRFLRDSNDPHLFAKFNNEQAAALLQHIAALEQRVKAAEPALQLAASTFRRYEALHAAKPDPVKAASNAALAQRMEEALAVCHALPKEPR